MSFIKTWQWPLNPFQRKSRAFVYFQGLELDRISRDLDPACPLNLFSFPSPWPVSATLVSPLFLNTTDAFPSCCPYTYHSLAGLLFLQTLMTTSLMSLRSLLKCHLMTCSSYDFPAQSELLHNNKIALLFTFSSLTLIYCPPELSCLVWSYVPVGLMLLPLFTCKFHRVRGHVCFTPGCYPSAQRILLCTE